MSAASGWPRPPRSLDQALLERLRAAVSVAGPEPPEVQVARVLGLLDQHTRPLSSYAAVRR